MKPWRRPGADQSDYFNYGFDEFSWAMYCEKVKSMKHGIDEQKSENAKFEAMMGPMPGMPGGGGGGGGQQGNNSPMPGMGGAGGGMPGMPSEQDMMNLTMQYMQANNIQDISQVDFGAVMQFMGGGGGGGGGGMGMGGGGQQGGQGGWGGQQQQQGGYGGGGGGGRRGRGRW
jgi:pre-mRNA 3'-end-processing factor FIP1